MVAYSRNFSLSKISFSTCSISFLASSYFLSISSFPSSSSSSYPCSSSTSISSCDVSTFKPYCVLSVSCLRSLAFYLLTLCRRTFFWMRIFSSLALSAKSALYSHYNCLHRSRFCDNCSSSPAICCLYSSTRLYPSPAFCPHSAATLSLAAASPGFSSAAASQLSLKRSFSFLSSSTLRSSSPTRPLSPAANSALSPHLFNSALF